jgi:hydroxymethylbilane synthase
MKKELIVATRGGLLAMSQTQIVVSLIRNLHPEMDIRIKKITSEGDKDQRTTLWELKSTGFFTSRLEDALLAHEADAAIHSYKDLPTALRQGLSIAAALNRQYPEDCLISAAPVEHTDELPHNAKVGTSSLRRTIQIKRLRKDLQCVPIRGNVTTRLKKLERGEFDAIVLARAGLERLGMSDKISIAFDPTQFLPAPAQGALAVQIRADDAETKEVIVRLDDEETRITTTAERLVFAGLKCGCHAPAGVFAEVRDEEITVSAFISDQQGNGFTKSSVSGPAVDYKAIAQSLASYLFKNHSITP